MPRGSRGPGRRAGSESFRESDEATPAAGRLAPVIALPSAGVGASQPGGHGPDLGRAVAEYLGSLRLAGRSPGTLRAYRVVLGDYARGGLAAALPDDLAPATRRMRYAVLRAFGRWAVGQGYLDADPLAATPAPRLAPAPPRAIPSDALERLGRVVADLDLAHRTLFTLLAETGLREAEAVSLRVRDVDLVTPGHESVRVLGKGGRVRVVPLPPGYESRRLLRRLLAGRPGEAPVFSANGDMPWSTSTVRKAWARVCARAGVEGYSVHALRHTAATRLVEHLGDLTLAQRLLGHASVATTARYAARGDEALREGMERVGGGGFRRG